MSGAHDLSRSPMALAEDSTLIAVVEMSQSSWLVAGLLPGVRIASARAWLASTPGW